MADKENFVTTGDIGIKDEKKVLERIRKIVKDKGTFDEKINRFFLGVKLDSVQEGNDLYDIICQGSNEYRDDFSNRKVVYFGVDSKLYWEDEFIDNIYNWPIITCKEFYELLDNYKKHDLNMFTIYLTKNKKLN